MPILRELTDAECAALWAEVRAEFPDDEMMQTVHFVRAMHTLQLRDFSREQRLAYFNELVPEHASPSGGPLP